MATAKPVLIATRILDYDRTALAADNADYTVNKGSKPNLIYVVQVDEEKGTWTATYKLQWKNTTDAGSFADLAATGEINWAATTSLVQGTAVTARSCTATGGSGSTWQNGEEVEGASTSDSIALVDEYYTEIHFAINCASAIEGKTYDFQVIESGGGTSINTFASSLIITSDQPSVVLNTTEAYEFATSTPTLEFTGTDASDSDIRYNIQIDTVATFDSVPNYITQDYIDPAQGGGTFYKLFSGGVISRGESFTASASAPITSVKFQIKEVGTAPDGNMTAILYEHSGVYGTSSLPTGGALATSDPISSSVLTSSYAEIEFFFTGAQQYSLTEGTYYVITVNYNPGSGDVSNCIQLDGDETPGHSGNACTYTTSWISVSYEHIFSVISDTTGPLLDKLSGTDLGFANTVTPADTDPFNSAEKCDYDVQAGEELADNTYYWRARGMDPSPGSGTYGSWAATQSFVVNTGGGGFNSKIMVDGAWKAVSSASVMVDGAWKAVNSMKVMVDGAWKAV